MPYKDPDVRRAKAVEYTRIYRARHPEHVTRDTENTRRWREKHPENNYAAVKRWAQRHPDKVIAYRRKYRERAGVLNIVRSFGVSEVEARRLFKIRRCAICGTTKGRFHTDHNHKTGKVRGRLCLNCNNGLGRFKDDARLLQKALRYLKKEIR